MEGINMLYPTSGCEYPDVFATTAHEYERRMTTVLNHSMSCNKRSSIIDFSVIDGGVKREYYFQGNAHHLKETTQDKRAENLVFYLKSDAYQVNDLDIDEMDDSDNEHPILDIDDDVVELNMIESDDFDDIDDLEQLNTLALYMVLEEQYSEMENQLFYVANSHNSRSRAAVNSQ